MKKLLLTLALGITILTYSQKNQQTTLKSENLKGSVYFIIETSYGAKEKFGTVEKYGVPTKYNYTYNEAGNITEKKFYGNDGSIAVKWTFDYNNGKQISENIIVNSSDPSIYLLYGEGKNIILKYDKGYLAERNEFSSTGYLLSKSKFKNDAKGNLIESNLYYGNGSLQFRFVIKRSKSGKESEKSKYDATGSLLEKTKPKHDEKGRYLGEDYYNGDNSLTSKNRFKYDSKGNIVETTFYNAEGNTNFKITYKYEYDRFGNWVSQTEFDNGIAKKIIERTIDYYQN